MNKICIVVPADFIGGAELFVLDFIENRKGKAEFFIIHSSNKAFTKRIKMAGAHSIIMEFPRLKKIALRSLFDYFSTTRKLKAKIKEINPDVVMSNAVRAHILCNRALKKEKIPFAMFVHDFTFPEWFVLETQIRADKIFVCSHAVKEDLVNKGAKPQKIEVIYNGVNVDDFKERNPRISKLRVGIIGRIEKWKGQDIFLDMTNMLSLKNFDFYVYGKRAGDDEKSLEYYHSLSRENAKFMGYVPAKEALANLDVLVHASREKEPFGRVIIEAMAAGVAVIASNLGGPREIIIDHKNGFLVEPGRPTLIAEKLILLIDNCSFITEITSQAKKDVEKYFSLDRVNEKLLKNLNDLCKK